MRIRAVAIVFLVTALLQIVFVGATEGASEQLAAGPSKAFLEYLGSFETNEGEWLDPMSLEETEDADLRGEARTAEALSKITDDRRTRPVSKEHE